ncbi:MAG: Na+/H+ antiporter subunit E [Clostridia bacterium]|nr:Na+/H+ antiporter subunit E [Clostridia bacterium]
MFIIFFLLWIIFNERVTMEIVYFGLGISALLYLFIVFFMDYSPKKEWAAVRKIPKFLKYIYTLLVEIFKANVGVMHFILSPKYEVEPQLVYFKTKLKKDVERVLLANSITLTPGTITVSSEEDLMCVHCLDKTLADGLEDSEFEKQLLEMEGMDK